MNEHEYLREAMQRIPPLIGERLCLNFVNTIEPRGDPYLSEQQRATQHEYLTSYSDFLAWSILAGSIMEEDAWHMQQQAAQAGSKADEVLKQIIALRERLYAIFWHIATSQTVQEQELDWLRPIYLDALSHAKLIKTEEHYSWQWTIEKEHLTSPIWPIVQSALELLTMEDLERIKICPGAPEQPIACSWLFYDESKNKSRHWCSMADCGNRTKALRLTAHRRARRIKSQA